MSVIETGGTPQHPGPTGNGAPNFNLSDFLGEINVKGGSGMIKPGQFAPTNPNQNPNLNFGIYNVGQSTGFAPPGGSLPSGPAPQPRYQTGGGLQITPGGGNMSAQPLTPQFGSAPSAGAFNGLNFGGSGADFQGLANAATGGTITNFNRAANRLRERLDAQASSQTQNNINGLGARGLGNSGAVGHARNQVQQNARNEYANGLVGLESQFEGFRQQGLQTALGSLQGRSNEALQGNELNQGLFKFIESQGQQGQQFLQELMSQTYEGASDRELEAMLAAAGLKTQEGIAEATGGISGFGDIVQLIGQFGGGPAPRG